MVLLEEDALEYLQAYIAKCGLRNFHPNLDESAYSLWSSAHRITALATFRHSNAIQTFSFLAPAKYCAVDESSGALRTAGYPSEERDDHAGGKAGKELMQAYSGGQIIN